MPEMTTAERRLQVLEDRFNRLAAALASVKLQADKAAQDAGQANQPQPSNNVLWLARVTTAITSVDATGDVLGVGAVEILRDVAGTTMNPGYPLQTCYSNLGSGTSASVPVKTNVIVCWIDGLCTLVSGNCYVTSNS